MSYNKTKTAYYRRLYVAYLIDSKINTVPAIVESTGMHVRTVQDIIASFTDYDIICEFIGARKNGHYEITHWAAIDKKWIINNLKHVRDVLEYI